MAKIYNGMIPFASAIKPTGAQPLDDRIVVQSYNDLINTDTFGLAKYVGMIVSVVDDQKLYMLINNDVTEKGAWKVIGDAIATSEVNTYTEALTLAKELPLGTLIKVNTDETISETKYNSGFYLVSVSGDDPSLLYLPTSITTDVDIDTLVTKVSELESTVGTINDTYYKELGVSYPGDSDDDLGVSDEVVQFNNRGVIDLTSLASKEYVKNALTWNNI